jgi:hypothetical protein
MMRPRRSVADPRIAPATEPVALSAKTRQPTPFGTRGTEQAVAAAGSFWGKHRVFACCLIERRTVLPRRRLTSLFEVDSSRSLALYAMDGLRRDLRQTLTIPRRCAGGAGGEGASIPDAHRSRRVLVRRVLGAPSTATSERPNLLKTARGIGRMRAGGSRGDPRLGQCPAYPDAQVGRSKLTAMTPAGVLVKCVISTNTSLEPSDPAATAMNSLVWLN